MWVMKKLEWVKSEDGSWFTQSITHEYRITKIGRCKYTLQWYNKVTGKNIRKTGFTSLQETRKFVEREHVPHKLKGWFTEVSDAPSPISWQDFENESK